MIHKEMEKSIFKSTCISLYIPERRSDTGKGEGGFFSTTSTSDRSIRESNLKYSS